MIETAGNLAREDFITREEADEYAVRSHLRAAQAWESRRFETKVVPTARASQRKEIECPPHPVAPVSPIARDVAA